MSLIRAGLCILLAFAVLAFGGVEEWAQGILEVGFSFLLVFWAVHQFQTKSDKVLISPLFPPLLLFALVVAIQLALHTTASIYRTRVELQLLLVYLVVIFLLPQIYQYGRAWRGTLWFLMSLGFAVSIFGILQQFTFNGKLYWIRVLRYGGIPFGPYVHRNYFAGFGELLIPVALVPLVLGKVRRERLIFVALFAVVPIVALI